MSKLIIEISDSPRDITIREDERKLGGIQSVKLHAHAFKIPPILEAELPDLSSGDFSPDMRAAVQHSIEALQRHGAVVKLLSLKDMAVDSNETEQGEAESTLKQIIHKD